MKKIRLLSIIVFLLSVAVSAGYRMYHKGTDSLPPVITMESDTIHASINDGEDVLLQGVTAMSGDNDISESLMIENLSNFIEPGRRQMTIAAVNESNQVGRTTAMVIYDDYESPHFQLDEPLIFRTGSTGFQENLTAEDCLDGDLSMKIKMTGEQKIQVDAAGEYLMTFSVANSAGDVAKLPATITILDNSQMSSLPEIALTDYLIYVKKGEKKLSPWDYVTQVNVRGRSYVPKKDEDGKPILIEKSQVQEAEIYESEDENAVIRKIRITNPVKMDEPGVYEVLYEVTTTGNDGNITGKVRLIVVVEGE